MEYEFELRLDVKKKGEIAGFDFTTIKADNLVQLLSQFNIALVMLMEKLAERQKISEVDDDIPF
jgi:hypothetical protein